jgi:hypothetical protein
MRGSAEDRFWNKVKLAPENECWAWVGGKSRKGYGLFHPKDHTMHAHRFSWVLENGEIPDSLLVLHKCDNPSCVNPKHLFLGTNKENMEDMTRKGRRVGIRLGKSNFVALGDKNPSTKIPDSEIHKIKTKYGSGSYTYRTLAHEYKVSISQIQKIVRGLQRKQTGVNSNAS